MPREQIVYPIAYVYDSDGAMIDEGHLTYVQETPEGGQTVVSNGLTVVWTREPAGRLQVGVEVSTEALRGVLKEVDAGRINPENGLIRLHTDLSRHEANALIRTVRRARNATFGADE